MVDFVYLKNVGLSRCLLEFGRPVSSRPCTRRSTKGRSTNHTIWNDDTVEGRWQERKVPLGKNKEILNAEMWGISDALKVAE